MALLSCADFYLFIFTYVHGSSFFILPSFEIRAVATVIPHSFAVGIWSFTGIFLSAREMVIWYLVFFNG